jgi:hypothetical protein
VEETRLQLPLLVLLLLHGLHLYGPSCCSCCHHHSPSCHLSHQCCQPPESRSLSNAATAKDCYSELWDHIMLAPAVNSCRPDSPSSARIIIKSLEKCCKNSILSSLVPACSRAQAESSSPAFQLDAELPGAEPGASSPLELRQAGARHQAVLQPLVGVRRRRHSSHQICDGPNCSIWKDSQDQIITELLISHFTEQAMRLH